jgi:hypothetical protein
VAHASSVVRRRADWTALSALIRLTFVVAVVAASLAITYLLTR